MLIMISKVLVDVDDIMGENHHIVMLSLERKLWKESISEKRMYKEYRSRNYRALEDNTSRTMRASSHNIQSRVEESQHRGLFGG